MILNSRLKSVKIFQCKEFPLLNNPKIKSLNMEYTIIEENDIGRALNNSLYTLDSSYVLFLDTNDYISPTVDSSSLQLPSTDTVLYAKDHNKNSMIRRPLLVSTTFLKNHHFFSSSKLPFKESLLPAWLSELDESILVRADNVIKRARKNNSAHTLEKLKFIQKYQLKKIKTDHPSISVIISNYNMEKYLEIAVMSCLLQSEQADQILIIDDGSTDNSYKLLQSLDDGKKVKVFKKQNGGKARALNDVLPHVTSDFILEVDADDWLDPDAVSTIKKLLSNLPNNTSVLYGNLRKWKQLTGDVQYKGISKGTLINGRKNLLSYRFPLGPRIYRTKLLRKVGGFPVVAFQDGKLYEDVSVLTRLIKNYPFMYYNFTVYNVREHMESITKNNLSNWKDYLQTLNKEQ